MSFPMTHDDDERHRAWRENARTVLGNAGFGRWMRPFITIGDPTIYSTFGYLVKAVIELNGDGEGGHGSGNHGVSGGVHPD